MPGHHCTSSSEEACNAHLPEAKQLPLEAKQPAATGQAWRADGLPGHNRDRARAVCCPTPGSPNSGACRRSMLRPDSATCSFWRCRSRQVPVCTPRDALADAADHHDGAGATAMATGRRCRRHSRYPGTLSARSRVALMRCHHSPPTIRRRYRQDGARRGCASDGQ